MILLVGLKLKKPFPAPGNRSRRSSPPSISSNPRNPSSNNAPLKDPLPPPPRPPPPLLGRHRHLLLPPPPPDPPPLPSPPSSTPRNFTFTIKLLAFDRPHSLLRCLRSLAAAHYSPDPAHLHIFLDHFHPINDSSLLDIKLEESHHILDLVDRFQWPHGHKVVHYRTANAGLQAQWLEAWWPASDDDFAFVVEDDLEVSPLYYRFLKGLIMRYYYDRGNYSPSVYGASLQRPRFVSGKHGNKLRVDGETHLFLYQMIGTWGQLLFPKPWKEFRLWYDVHKAKGIKPFLQGMVSTGWYKKMGEKIWTPWFIKFIHQRGYYNIYTNFPHESALSISHRDTGVNYGKSAGPDSNMLRVSPLDFNLWELHPLKNLKWYDFCFREVFPGRVLRSYDELGSFLDSRQSQKTVTILSLYRTTERVTRNLLCHLERLGLHNVVFVGGSLEFLLDLARRGYSVIDSEMLIKSMGLKPSDEELVKEIWVKASMVKKYLELGYDTWVIDGNIIPTSVSLTELMDPTHSFFAAADVDLMFVKSSPTSLNVWDNDFISKMVTDTKTSSVEHRHFAYSAIKILEKISAARISRLDELGLGVKIGDVAINQTSIKRGWKMVFWSQEMSLDSIKRELENLGLWLIDGDSSCVAVICNPLYVPS